MTDLVGQQLGQYLITGVLGEGSTATVYRGRQASVERDVAIKVIETRLTQSPDFIKRFEREAKTVASLSHPHILKLFDFGSQKDLLYLVMELVAGGSLAAHLRARGRLDAEEVATYLDQIGKALDHAHARGIVHRDLKPQNILLDQDGNAILTDFGIARISDELMRMTSTGTAMGTPSYMAPEQWQGQSVDGRTDIYAMAVMAYELLTGELPFAGDTLFALIYQHLYDKPPSLHSKRPELPQSLEQVLLKGMAKAPEERFQSASAFAKAFREALSGKTPVGVDVNITRQVAQPLSKEAVSTEATSDSPTATSRKVQRQHAALPRVSGIVIVVAVLLSGAILLVSRAISPRLLSQTFTPSPVIGMSAATDVATLTPTSPKPTLPPAIAAQTDVFAGATSAVLVHTLTATATSAAARTPVADTSLPLGARLFVGPINGVLVHNPHDGLVERRYFGNSRLRDSVIEARFYVPYAGHAWSHGFFFRDTERGQYRLVISHSKSYALLHGYPDSAGNWMVETINSGSIKNLTVEPDSSIWVRLIVQGEVAVLFVNGELIAELDVSHYQRAGFVGVGTGFYPDNEKSGAVTRYEKFTVWTLDGAALPTPTHTATPSQAITHTLTPDFTLAYRPTATVTRTAAPLG